MYSLAVTIRPASTATAKKTVAKSDQRHRGKTAARTGWRESGVTRRSQSRYESIRLVQSLQWERGCYL